MLNILKYNHEIKPILCGQKSCFPLEIITNEIKL